MRRTITLAVSLAALLTTACQPLGGRVCSAAGCGYALEVTLERPAWTPGRYTVAVTADGQTHVCKVTLPHDCERLYACGEDSPLSVWVQPCGPSPSEHALKGIALRDDRGPKSITLRIEQDGALIGEADYTPTYVVSQPNGPDCEPTCNTAPPTTLVLK